MNRGADRQDIFVHDVDYLEFERLIGVAVGADAVEVHAYCLMNNHFHLLLSCPNGGLSTFMQSVQFRYAQWFNQRYERDGSVFRGRFTSVNVDSDEQLVQVGRYIHRNPLAFVPPEALAAYRWSSLGAYVGARPPADWLVRGHLLGEFADDVERFRRHVDTEQPGDRFGSSPFGIDSAITCDQIDGAVAAAAGVDSMSLRSPVRGSQNVARLVAISLCVEFRAATVGELALHYGMANQASVRVVARRGRVLQQSDETVRSLRHRAVAAISRAA
jgi:REP element-mobilizing transposase RayT